MCTRSGATRARDEASKFLVVMLKKKGVDAVLPAE